MWVLFWGKEQQLNALSAGIEYVVCANGNMRVMVYGLF